MISLEKSTSPYVKLKMRFQEGNFSKLIASHPLAVERQNRQKSSAHAAQNVLCKEMMIRN